MVIGRLVFLLPALLTTMACADPNPTPDHGRFRWQSEDGHLTLTGEDKPVWSLNFDPKQPKSYFHPLSTVDGQVLTDSQPADHPWHRGLWFSWKKINGKVYWEEDHKTGRGEGVTEHVSAKVEPHPDFSADIVLQLAYHEPDGPVLFRKDASLAPRSTFMLRCRVMVHGEMTHEALETAAASYAKSP